MAPRKMLNENIRLKEIYFTKGLIPLLKIFVLRKGAMVLVKDVLILFQKEWSTFRSLKSGSESAYCIRLSQNRCPKTVAKINHLIAINIWTDIRFDKCYTTLNACCQLWNNWTVFFIWVIVRYTWIRLVMLIRLFHVKILYANNWS